MQTTPLSSATPALPKRSFWRHPLGITLGVLLGLAGVATAAVGIWWKTNFDPAPFIPVSLTTQEQAAFDQKLAAFPVGSPAAAPAPPVTDLANRTLVITEREVNAWLAKNELGEHVQGRFKNGKITGALLLDIPQDFPVLAGQRIKASLGLTAHLDGTSRHLALVVDEPGQLLGKILPPERARGGERDPGRHVTQEEFAEQGQNVACRGKDCSGIRRSGKGEALGRRVGVGEGGAKRFGESLG